MALTVLDAGVLIGALDAEDPHHRSAVRVLRHLRAERDELAVPASAYAETLVQPLRRGETAAARVDAFLHDLGVRVEPATHRTARIAAELRASHGPRLRLPDAFVIATGIEHDAALVVTTDGRWPSDLPLAVEVL